MVNPSGRIYSVKRPPNEGLGQGERGDGSREEDPEGLLAVPFEESKNPPIFRVLLFFAFSTFTLYSGAAYLTLNENADMSAKIGATGIGSSVKSIFGDFGSFFGLTGNGNGVQSKASSSSSDVRYDSDSERRMRAARKQATAERLGRRLSKLMGWCDQLNIGTSGKEFVGRTYTWAAESYLNLPVSKEALVPIVAINTVIFLGWRFSALKTGRNALQRFMTRNFLHAPSSGRSFTLLTSTFSHYGLLHFLFNNVALWSFGVAAFFHPAFYAGKDGKGRHTPEASIVPHIMAFFATAGVFSALLSHMVTAVRFRALAAKLGTDLAKFAIGRRGSLGASGAVYSLIVMTAIGFPEAQISLIFLPMFPISIGLGVGAMVCVDIMGALLRWKMFDHVAHLGGAAFGLFYWYYGNELWEACKLQMREVLKSKRARAIQERI
ncbi:hypothetical protein CBS101457_002751 [Exobasidium rhododendri]|nr:hypothetical protein CBS101457_002751 [Exobasidium rhododendri]